MVFTIFLDATIPEGYAKIEKMMVYLVEYMQYLIKVVKINVCIFPKCSTHSWSSLFISA